MTTITARECYLAYVLEAERAHMVHRRSGKTYTEREHPTPQRARKGVLSFADWQKKRAATEQSLAFKGFTDADGNGIILSSMEELINEQSQWYTDWDVNRRTGAGFIDPSGKVWQLKGYTHLGALKGYKLDRDESILTTIARLRLIRFLSESGELGVTVWFDPKLATPEQHDQIRTMRRLWTQMQEFPHLQQRFVFEIDPMHSAPPGSPEVKVISGTDWNDFYRKMGMP